MPRRSPRRKLIRKHDAFIKRMLDQPDVARSLIREHLPPAIVAQLSDAPPERVPGSFVSRKFRESRTDRLFRVWTRSGRAAFLYILIEHKSAPDPRIGVHLLTYLERIYLWWLETYGRTVAGRLPRLPAIIPLVIYNGKAEWKAPLRFADGVEADDSLRPWLLDFPIPLLDLQRRPDDALSENPRLRAGLLVLRVGGERRDLRRTLVELARIAAAFGDDDLYALLHYVLDEIGPTESALVRDVLEEIAPEATEAIMQTLGDVLRGNAKAEGRAELLIRQIERRIGSLPSVAVDRIRAAELEQMDAWLDELIDTGRVDSLVARDRTS